MELPQTAISKLVEPFLAKVGLGVSVIWVLLMAIIVLNVFARYILSEGRIEFEEVQWHLYSTGFMLAMAYCVVTDSHIRVDVLHEKFKPETKVLIDLYGYILFVLPFVALILIYGVPFVLYSYETGEVSASPGGLPFRWLIKSVMLVGFALVGLAVVSRCTRLVAYLYERFQKIDSA
ncbi:MAG: TRAP transporter small permease subunit [Gammaproteobacteria bacterium]|nr:TRAP transporter small permease subunit [Gammaproteobacteria bacterium]